jgi:5-methylcytosine-specific restriction enzyme A
MPRALRTCAAPGCPTLVGPGPSYCAAHLPLRQPWPEQQHRLSPSRRGYGFAWQQLRRRYLRLHPECVTCGADATEVDHMLPLQDGGTNDDDNLQALCHACHSRKTLHESQARWQRTRAQQEAA